MPSHGINASSNLVRGAGFAYTVTACYNLSMNENDLSYIAGFFDGEGCAALRMVKNSSGNRTARVEARIGQNDREVLDWIQKEFGFGRVFVKKDKRNPNLHHSLQFTWKSARVFLTTIEPYLKIKKAHVTQILDQCGREALTVN